jgi:hypothetical protein
MNNIKRLSLFGPLLFVAVAIATPLFLTFTSHQWTEPDARLAERLDIVKQVAAANIERDFNNAFAALDAGSKSAAFRLALRDFDEATRAINLDRSEAALTLADRNSIHDRYDQLFDKHNAFLHQYATMAGFADLLLIGPDGYFLYTSASSDALGRSISDTDKVSSSLVTVAQKAFHSPPGPIASSGLILKNEDAGGLYLAVAVMDATGENRLGIAAVVIRPRFIIERFKAAENALGDQLVTFTLFTGAKEWIIASRPTPLSAETMTAIKSANEPTGVITEFDTVTVFGTFSLFDDPYLIAATGRTVSQKTRAADLAPLFIVTFLIGAAAIGIVRWWVNRQVAGMELEGSPVE